MKSDHSRTNMRLQIDKWQFGFILITGVLLLFGIYTSVKWWDATRMARKVIVYNYPRKPYIIKGDKALFTETLMQLANKAHNLCDCDSIYSLWEHFTLEMMNSNLSKYWLSRGVDCGCTHSIFMDNRG